MADEIGELRSVMKKLLGEEVVFKEITGRKKLSQRLGLSSSINIKLLEYIEERMALSKFGL